MNEERYFAMTLDPIHVGTGGYRLGRVDNAIVREPGTNLPKIPGTTIEGGTRTYAYYAELGNNDSKDKDNKPCALGKELDGKKPCGCCPVCITFGYTGAESSKTFTNDKGEEEVIKIPESLHGMAQFSDAQILFFPVHSMLGPVWITSASVLGEINAKDKLNFNSIKVPEHKGEITISKQIGDEHKSLKKLNLGWLYLNLKKDGDNNFKTNDFTQLAKFKEAKVDKEVLKRVIIVHNDLFDKIVNSNLEVRTSVAIDPETGAAKEHALFTYEAIPRATVLWFDVVFNDPKNFDVKIKKNGTYNKTDRAEIKSTVEKGFGLFETLGIGGMQTRGFGRIRVLNLRGDTNGGK